MGSSSASRNVDVLREKKFSIFGFTFAKDLDPVRMFFAEVLGTFILMFCLCGIIASTQLMRGDVGLLEYAATGGLTITVLIFSIGPISGAHLNPSVTIAFATLGAVPWSRVPFYIAAQFLGSIFGTFAGISIYNIRIESIVTQPLQGLKTAFFAEFMATFIIMFLAALISCAPHARTGQVAAFAMGVSIALAILITGPVSGGSMNPARSIAPALISWNFEGIWLYILAPTVGAVLGASVARVLRLQSRSCSLNSSPNAGLICQVNH
ncbi:hypothetical protein Sjap_007790 [Stephania japonica]|uniref:Aquaporin NIP7-1 n=1 Tax=Stephania japonica TaxID=461633 RepID=A0AAP0JN95_9MAGN